MLSHPNYVGSGNIDIPAAQLNIKPSNFIDIPAAQLNIKPSNFIDMVEGQGYQGHERLLCNEKIGQPFIDKD